jgi:hypothetical protein
MDYNYKPPKGPMASRKKHYSPFGLVIFSVGVAAALLGIHVLGLIFQ